MPRPHGNDLQLGIDQPSGKPIIFPASKRSTHLYVCGSTGTGKSKFLEHLIRQDIEKWRLSKSGLLLIDPHGSLYDSIMEWMAFRKLRRPVVPIDLRSNEWIVAYNMLRQRPGADPSVIVSNFVQAMAHVWGQSGTNETPLFARWAGNILRTLYESGQTLIEAEYLIDYLAADIRRTFTAKVKNDAVVRDWRYADGLRPSEFESQISSTVNRLRRFLATDMLRSIFGQNEVSLDLGTALREGHIILVNLAPKGARISSEDATLFGTLLLSDLWTAAQERGKGTAQNPTKPFYIYCDEFQNFVTPSISEQLDQARGFGLHLTLAHQYPNQLLHSGEHGKAIYDSVMVNARSKVVFQVEGEENLRPLANSLFMGAMNPDEIKLELYSTKVIGHTKETRRSVTRSRASTESEAGGTGRTYLEDEPGLNDRLSEQNSFSRGTSEGYSETEMEVDAAVFGKELSSVQFRDLEEQKFRAMATLFAQEQRACVARLSGERLPLTMQIPPVKGYRIKDERKEEYVNTLLQPLSYALPVAEAQEQIKDRRDAVLKRTKQRLEDCAPKTARRRIG